MEDKTLDPLEVAFAAGAAFMREQDALLCESMYLPKLAHTIRTRIFEEDLEEQVA